ncbi:major facilitator superfamily transporter [Fusarium sp. NRRL 52700]|nr:major facilitator superfamily transporter [Fusarium sp. NRRL 52700]
MESSSVISWLGASYLIATALIQPLCGQLSDIYTRRCCFFVGSLAFLLGNVACTIAPSLVVLLAGRALSGVGGGILTIMPTIILTDITSQKERGLWQGMNNIVFGLGHGMGGTFGGLMAHYWSWRTAFLSLAFPTVLLAIGTTVIPEPAKSSHPDR